MKRTGKALSLLLLCGLLLGGMAAQAAPDAPDSRITTYENRTVSGEIPCAAGSTVQILSRPESGVVSLTESGYIYTPYQNRRGEDQFTYLIRDEHGAWSREATVTVNVLPQESAFDYADLHGHPAEYAALRLAEEGVYAGPCYGGDRYFHPDEALSRAEFLALTLSAAGIPAVRAASVSEAFPALPAWAGGYAAAAVQEGIIRGGDDGADPLRLTSDAPITWAEAAVILGNTLGLPEGEGSRDAIPAWAASAWRAVSSAGYPVAQHLPEAAVTRADAAMLLARLLPAAGPVAPTGLFSWTTVL
ncbi:MAG: hypothetical protein E7458_00710 [Ruminococcaceae bacterium]|nr:hypothetical protein [Oscillospiraceae bacterium]